MIEEIRCERIGERCFRYVHESGVTVLMSPMEGYSGVCAQFSAKFGAIDNNYCLAGGESVIIPDGTAHFMEHKLFESPEKDAFALFAKTGASANAGTSYDSTCYYFNCTDNFAENLGILLDFVQHPFFTPENIQKEMGIIGQEITMYLDNPSWRVIMELLKNVYAQNPIRADIAGTSESISHITDKLLYSLYDIFYNPTNMYLSISGNFDLEEAVAVCEKKLMRKKPLDFTVKQHTEQHDVVCTRTEMNMPVSKPQFAIGFKRADADGKAALLDYTYLNVLFDIIFGDTSDFYTRLRDSGLINDTFRTSVFMGRNYVMPLVTGESDDPDKVFSELKAEIRRFKNNPPEREMFERVKKSNYGCVLRGYNNVESVAQSMTDTALMGLPPYTMIEAVAEVAYEKMCELLCAFEEENSCISIIYPSEK